MFSIIPFDQRLVILQAATNYIAATSEIYDPDDLAEKLDEICEILTKKLRKDD